MKDKLKEIEDLIWQYGQTDGSHHKAWVIDQVMRIIKGDDYEEWVHSYEYRDVFNQPTAEKEYDWDPGIAP